MNPLKQLPQRGLSIWLNRIDRHLVTTDRPARLVAEDALHDVASNPAMFEKAIAADPDHRLDLAKPHAQKLSTIEILERLVLPDICAAADQLRAVYAATDTGDATRSRPRHGRNDRLSDLR